MCNDPKGERRNWSSNRVVEEWNRLNEQVVRADSVESFKGRLHAFMDRDDR